MKSSYPPKVLTELENNIFEFALQLEYVSSETKTHIFKQWTTNKISARKIPENTSVFHMLQINAAWYLNVCQGSTGRKRTGKWTAWLLQPVNSGAARKSYISSDWCAKTGSPNRIKSLSLCVNNSYPTSRFLFKWVSTCSAVTNFLLLQLNWTADPVEVRLCRNVNSYFIFNISLKAYV